jgi:hypothetical protein
MRNRICVTYALAFMLTGLTAAGGGMARAVSYENARAGIASAASARALRPSAGCAQMLFLGARGTGEIGPGSRGWPGNRNPADPNGLGAPIDSLLKTLTADISGHLTIQSVSVRYDSSSIDTLIHDHARYFANLQAGVDWTLNFLSAQTIKCPDQKVMLAGYSQGAMVMHRLLRELGTKLMAKVSAVVLVGDGDQVANDTVTRYGTAPLGAVGIGHQYPALSLYSKAKFSVGVGARVLSVCTKDDPVCDWHVRDLLCGTDKRCWDKFFKIHESYPGSKPLNEVASAAAKRVLPGLQVDPDQGPPGTAVTLTGSLFLPGETVAVTDPTSSGAAVCSGSAGPAGSFSCTGSIPAAAPNGLQQINATGQSSGLQATASFDVVAPAVWGDGQEVPGSGSLNLTGFAMLVTVSCSTGSYCAAGGAYQDSSYKSQAFVVSESGGTWANAQEVPGTATLNSGGDAEIYAVSCSSAGNCGAGGSYNDGSGNVRAMVAGESGGTWSDAAALDSGALSAGHVVRIATMSCPSVGNCAAGGYYTYGTASADTGAFVADEANGTWGSAQYVPGIATLNDGAWAQVISVSCASAGNCAAAGFYKDSAGRFQAFVANEINGIWGTALQVPGIATLSTDGSSQAYSVSCATAGNCAVGGSYTDSAGKTQAFVADEVNGTWADAQQVPGTSSLNTYGIATVLTMSCPSAGNCAAGGYYSTGFTATQAFAADEVDGTWGSAEQAPGTATLNSGNSAQISSISCTSAGNCDGGGYYTDSTGNVSAMVITEANDNWGTAQQVKAIPSLTSGGHAEIDALSCSPAGNCAAGGYYIDISRSNQVFAVSKP